jgi:hypothetical protein
MEEAIFYVNGLSTWVKTVVMLYLIPIALLAFVFYYLGKNRHTEECHFCHTEYEGIRYTLRRQGEIKKCCSVCCKILQKRGETWGEVLGM